MSWHEWRGPDLLLTLRVQPRSSQEGLRAEAAQLKVHLRAAPVDGAANAALIRLLAKTFGVTQAQVQVLSGLTGRTKRVQILAPRLRPACIPPP